MIRARCTNVSCRWNCNGHQCCNSSLDAKEKKCENGNILKKVDQEWKEEYFDSFRLHPGERLQDMYYKPKVLETY